MKKCSECATACYGNADGDGCCMPNVTSKKIFKHVFIIPLPVFTPEGTIGLPSVRQSVSLSVRQSVCLSAKILDPFITSKLLKLGT